MDAKEQETLTEGERLSTVNLLIKVVCFVTKVSKIFNFKMSLSKLFSRFRSTVLSIPLQGGFPARTLLSD